MMRLIPLVLALSCIASVAHAEVNSLPSKSDPRIREFAYQDNEVYRIDGYLGYVQSVIFGNGELIETVEIGDSKTWKAELNNGTDRLSMKPVLVPEFDTNMTVTTNIRTYTFILQANKPTRKKGIEAFRYQFVYPEKATAQKLNSMSDAYYAAAKGQYPLNRDYLTKGDKLYQPHTAWDDGQKTYLKLPEVSSRAAIFEVNQDGTERLINSRDLDDGTIIIDGVYAQLSIRDGAAHACLFNRPFYEYARLSGRSDQ